MSINFVVDLNKRSQSAVPREIKDENPDKDFRWVKDKPEAISRRRNMGWSVYQASDEILKQLDYLFEQSSTGVPLDHKVRSGDVILMTAPKGASQAWTDAVKAADKAKVKGLKQDTIRDQEKIDKGVSVDKIEISSSKSKK